MPLQPNILSTWTAICHLSPLTLDATFSYLVDLLLGPAYPDITECSLLEDKRREWKKNQIAQVLESARNKLGDQKQSIKVSLGNSGDIMAQLP